MSEIRILRLLDEGLKEFQIDDFFIKHYVNNIYYIDFLINSETNKEILESNINNIYKIDASEYDEFSDGTTFCKFMIKYKENV